MRLARGSSVLLVLQGSVSGAVDAESCNCELAQHPDDDDGNNWNFADVPVSCHVDVGASLCQDFESISGMCCSANVAVPGDAGRVSSLFLPKLDAIMEWKSATAAKDMALERVHVNEKTTVASQVG